MDKTTAYILLQVLMVICGAFAVFIAAGPFTGYNKLVRVRVPTGKTADPEGKIAYNEYNA